MAGSSDRDLLEAVLAGNDHAFELVYDRYRQQARLIAWRLSGRGDWVDDIVNESWCRAFRLRKTYNPERSFMVWLTGILQNVYREHCRNSPLTTDASADRDAGVEVDERQPEALVAEAELLEKLNGCVLALPAGDQVIVRLRFFEDKPLRLVAQEVRTPESTLRDVRIPAIYKALRRCLAKKGIEISEVFPAHDRLETQ